MAYIIQEQTETKVTWCQNNKSIYLNNQIDYISQSQSVRKLLRAV
jgi:hypothetical protein